MTPMVMASPVRRIEDTMQRRTSDWTSSIRDDLETVKKRIELDDVEHLRFVDPIIGTSIQRQAYIPSGLMLLTARAFALDASGEEALCAFAAAMELIVMSLGAHAKLPERRALQAAEPMLALGPHRRVARRPAVHPRFPSHRANRRRDRRSRSCSRDGAHDRCSNVRALFCFSRRARQRRADFIGGNLRWVLFDRRRTRERAAVAASNERKSWPDLCELAASAVDGPRRGTNVGCRRRRCTDHASV